MNPTAPILDYSEDHEFVSANQLDDYYAKEDQADAIEEEQRKLTKGKAAKTAIQRFYKDQCVFLTGGTGFLGKGWYTFCFYKVIRCQNEKVSESIHNR